MFSYIIQYQKKRVESMVFMHTIIIFLEHIAVCNLKMAQPFG